MQIESENQTKRLYFRKGAWSGRICPVCTVLHSLGDALMFLSFPTQPLCRASSVGNAHLSDGETEAARKADIPEVSWQASSGTYQARGAESREEACRPALGDPDSHLRYSSEPSPSGSYRHPHPRLRRRDGWEPRLCTSVPHQHFCSGPGSSPGNPISRPGQATLTPSPSHWDLNNGPCGGAGLRSRLACPFASPSFGVPWL